MADGTRTQAGFNFPHLLPVSALRAGEIVVDLFAGGGGASEALRRALGRDPDIAINHDAWAIGMHSANHPFARHLCEDVWHANPRAEVAGRAVGGTRAVKMVGNSVSPPPLAAIARANLDAVEELRAAA